MLNCTAAYKRLTSGLRSYICSKLKARWKVFHESGKQKRAGVTIPISDNIGIKTKMVI